MNFHEFPWKSHIFHKMGARPPPWWKPLIFLREFWCFWRVRAPQNGENPENPRFYGKSAKFPIFHVFFIKSLKICCFPHFPVKRVSGITNNPLGLSMVSALEAEGPPFYQKYRKSMEFHEKTMISAKFREFHAFFVKWRPRRPHGWNHWYSLGNIGVLGRPCNRKIQNSRKTSVFMVKTENSAKIRKSWNCWNHVTFRIFQSMGPPEPPIIP